jgi:hypothetical protein
MKKSIGKSTPAHIRYMIIKVNDLPAISLIDVVIKYKTINNQTSNGSCRVHYYLHGTMTSTVRVPAYGLCTMCNKTRNKQNVVGHDTYMELV